VVQAKEELEKKKQELERKDREIASLRSSKASPDPPHGSLTGALVASSSKNLGLLPELWSPVPWKPMTRSMLPLNPPAAAASPSMFAQLWDLLARQPVAFGYFGLALLAMLGKLFAKR
jgi:hypothetical protein